MFNEKHKNPKSIPKLDMILLKKSKTPQLIPNLVITVLILGPNPLIPLSRVGGPGGDSLAAKNGEKSKWGIPERDISSLCTMG